jgi:predicted  nucleic acid-binding Zn-ribbon protein
MELNEKLEKLREIQIIDLHIYQREKELVALDNGDEIKKKAFAAMKQLDAFTPIYRKLESDLKDLELKMKGIEDKKRAVHFKLSSRTVTSHKEIEALQRDEEMLGNQIHTLESDILEKMDELEKSTAEFNTMTETVGKLKHLYQKTVLKFKTVGEQLRSEIAVLKPQREALAGDFEDKLLLKKYDAIRGRSAGQGLVVTGVDICPACSTKINNTIISQAREGEDLTCCGNCGRILYWKG